MILATVAAAATSRPDWWTVVATVAGVGLFVIGVFSVFGRWFLGAARGVINDEIKDVIRDDINPQFAAVNARFDGIDDHILSLQREDGELGKRVSRLEGYREGRESAIREMERGGSQ